KPETRIHSDRLQAVEGLVQAGGNHAVVGRRVVSNDISITRGEPSEAIQLAYRMGVMFEANPRRHLEPGCDLPLVLRIYAEVILGDRSGETQGKSLRSIL